jgi:hypothetical protein
MSNDLHNLFMSDNEFWSQTKHKILAQWFLLGCLDRVLQLIETYGHGSDSSLEKLSLTSVTQKASSQ